MSHFHTTLNGCYRTESLVITSRDDILFFLQAYGIKAVRSLAESTESSVAAECDFQIKSIMTGAKTRR